MAGMEKPRFPPVMLQPAWRLAFVLVLVHTGIGGLLLFMPLPYWMLGMLMACVLVSAVHAVRGHALRRNPRSVTSLRFHNREQVEIGRRDGSRQSGCILGSSTAGTLLTVLNIRLEQQRRPEHVVVTRDSLDDDEFRRLRVWLRWGPLPEDRQSQE
jgi:toxin CptA